ncbi:MAG: helix-turn-helix domain-containing protein, partial [Nanoarchaeota archaeon]|nr:helix-turn-helix domain-containing protein [Nanoarchaeota archaeon]
MDLSVLKKVGLSEGEIKIYQALLNLGKSPINKIHEKTGMERRNIYDVLNKLIEKGLVVYTGENKKRRFNLSNPQKILSYLEEKNKTINNTKKEVADILPSLT